MNKRLFAIPMLLGASTVFAAADGELDTGFGLDHDGTVVIAPSSGADQAADVLAAPNGKVYIVGNIIQPDDSHRVVLMRLNADGTPDDGFAPGGTLVPLTTNMKVAAAAFDASGNILVAGSYIGLNSDTDFDVCKFSPDGAPVSFITYPHPCFTVFFDLGGEDADTVRDILMLPDGRIVLVGSATGDNDTEHGAIVMLKPDGSLDKGFDKDGRLDFLGQNLARVRFNAAAIYRGAPDRILVVGEAWLQNNVRFKYSCFVNSSSGAVDDCSMGVAGTDNDVFSSNHAYAIAGTTIDNGETRARLDVVGGSATLDLGDATEFDRVLAQDLGRRFLVSGHRTLGGVTRSMVARYTFDAMSNLVLDTGFAPPNGWRTIDFGLVPDGHDSSSPGGFALHGGRPLLATTVQNTDDLDIGAARLDNDYIFADDLECPMCGN